ncbi:hypothetical protein BGX29_008216 [Mortierella sp. GBA35]|nr:hypothetical protein BGX29_008216 [Mortierella sp. GBA35]
MAKSVVTVPRSIETGDTASIASAKSPWLRLQRGWVPTGYTGYNTQVGYVDSETWTTQAKYMFDAHKGSDPFARSPPTTFRARHTHAFATREGVDDGNLKYELGSRLRDKI